MRNNKHLYGNYWDNSVDDEDNREQPHRSKAIAIGAIITFSVIVAALKLWNVFQRP